MSENSVRPLNILGEICGQYGCSYYQPPCRNPEIMRLQSRKYQEEYWELTSNFSDKPLGVYVNENEEYISKEEYNSLPKTPQRLKDLIHERTKCLAQEAAAGILHGDINCAMQKIPVPELTFDMSKEYPKVE